ncbi:hypothetical protein [Xanthobacter agilis]|uniref:hypothetical protein n=1 Tax=Xanthobacter agilis TaxID=47492 RepID=UPI00372906B9
MTQTAPTKISDKIYNNAASADQHFEKILYHVICEKIIKPSTAFEINTRLLTLKLIYKTEGRHTDAFKKQVSSLVENVENTYLLCIIRILKMRMSNFCLEHISKPWLLNCHKLKEDSFPPRPGALPGLLTIMALLKSIESDLQIARN